jgi:hypothetical protein
MGRMIEQTSPTPRLTLDSDGLADRIDISRLSLVNRNLPLLVPSDEPGGLDNTPGLQGSYSDGRQQGREQEVVSGRDDDDVVFLVIEVFEERGGSPSVTEYDDGLLLGVLIQLSSGIEILLSDCDPKWEWYELNDMVCEADVSDVQ